jgi:hypothetical protein
MTMFDDYAFRTTRRLPGLKKLKAKDYLVAFEKEFAKRKSEIIEAGRFSDRKYRRYRRLNTLSC